jgi:anti-sigma-K factor RskA
MTVTPETLMAFIDGELPADEQRRVAAEVAKDPALAVYVEQQKKLMSELQAAFAPVMSAPIPARIEKTVWETEIPTETNFAKPLLARLSRIWRQHVANAGSSWIPAGAMAAGIVLGVLLAGSFGTGTLVRSDDGALVAQGELAQTLTTELAAEQSSERPSAARIGVSFWSKEGTFCRSFTTRQTTRGALAGVACRDNDSWRITTLEAAEPQEGTAFSTSGAEMPASVRAAVTAMISGDPLDADQERAARNQNWRVR